MDTAKEATVKARQTRITRLTEGFQATYGRMPNVDEINALYSAEMRSIGAKSRRNSEGKGGFAKLKQADPERAKQIQSMGGKARWSKRDKP